MNTVIPNSVTSIGSYAFLGCSGLTSVTIPESVTSIGSDAFRGCSGLTSVTIPESVTSIGSDAFRGCSSLTSVAFNAWNCTSCGSSSEPAFPSNITTLTIGNEVKTIPSYAFKGCSRLTSVTIPESVTSIGYYAFRDCSGLTSVTIHSNVIASKSYSSSQTLAAVFGSQVTGYTFGDEVRSIGTNALLGCEQAQLYAHRGATALFALWEAGYKNVKEAGGEVAISPLDVGGVTASSIKAMPYYQGPANITAVTLSLNERTETEDSLYANGLNPGTAYPVAYRITVDDEYEYQGTVDIATEALTLTTQQPKVVSEGNIIVSAVSNLDDEEENVGFEWRRTDWTDDFDSKTGSAYLYEGQMEGYIRSLNANHLWKYRPYYEADDGTRYYGEWKGIDPSDYSYYEPTVHTYAKMTLGENSAEVKGYVQRGTDSVVSQGFLYWKVTSPQSSPKEGMRKVPAIPSDAIKVEATGTVMTVSLTGLDYGTEYCYVAYVKTSEGETFYGEVQHFTTGEDPTGIESIHNSQCTMHNEAVAVYDLSGRRVSGSSKCTVQSSEFKVQS